LLKKCNSTSAGFVDDVGRKKKQNRPHGFRASFFPNTPPRRPGKSAGTSGSGHTPSASGERRSGPLFPPALGQRLTAHDARSNRGGRVVVCQLFAVRTHNGAVHLRLFPRCAISHYPPPGAGCRTGDTLTNLTLSVCGLCPGRTGRPRKPCTRL